MKYRAIFVTLKFFFTHFTGRVHILKCICAGNLAIGTSIYFSRRIRFFKIELNLLFHQVMNSTLSWTQELTATLHIVINMIKSTLGVDRVRILDVPCGDMAWMSKY